jgi:hypothetical protein
MHWRLILPVIGLLLLGAESYHSFRVNRQLGTVPRRYYFWSSIRLDSDPLNRRFTDSAPFKSGDAGFVWEPNQIWIDPGYFAKSLVLAALPAFALGAVAVRGLAHLGVSEVWSFGAVMPVLVFAWFYSVGWLIDRWIRKRSQTSTLGSD